MVLALAFSSVVCVALAGKALSVIRLSASVVFSQVVLHALFTVGGSSVGGALLSVSGMGHGAHQSMVMVVPGAASAAAAAAATAATTAAAATHSVSLLDVAGAQLCSGMWIAHGVAAVITIIALRHGEWAIMSLLQLAGLRLARLFRALFVEPSPLSRLDRGTRVAEPDHLRDLGVFLGRLRHRGPPVCVRFSL